MQRGERMSSRNVTLSQSIKAIDPGIWFHGIMDIYSDRKLVMVLMLHFTMTLVTFSHFALIKYHSQTAKVPEAAPYYNMKIGVPTFEFGTMHAILLQLALIPLTMCRYITAKGSTTFLNEIIPFNEMTKCHIAIGYALVAMLFVTIVVFFIFFGILCQSGNQTFCDNFTSEIMITGYVIFAAFMTVGATSYVRFKIPYRIFYILHHIVFAAYILVIVHTFDVVERNKGSRSQTFKWFSASILIYICDRTTMYLNNRYFSSAVSIIAIGGKNEEKMVIVKARKPFLFNFSPGQYVQLKIPSVNQQWHPFSISSPPDSDHLDFHIKVSGPESWSGRLFEMVKMNEETPTQVPSFSPRIEVLGPYGTPIGDKMDYSHALLIGTGTGFVPCISFLQEHMNQCISLEPEEYDKYLAKHQETMKNLYQEKGKSQSILGFCLAGGKLSTNDSEDSDINISQRAAIARRQITMHTLLLPVPVFGCTMFALTLSWNYLPFDMYIGMDSFLLIGTVIFHAVFAIVTFAYQDASRFWTYQDVVFVAISVVADWYWTSKDLWSSFQGDSYLVYYSLLILYMVGRLWYTAVIGAAMYNPVKESNTRRSGLVIFEKVRFILISRSAVSLKHIFPDIEAKWGALVDAWGVERARDVCEIDIYCTDKNRAECQQLADSLQDTNLYLEGALTFGRPSVQKVVGDFSRDIANGPAAASNTLIGFCGSNFMAQTVKEAKIYNDMFLSMTDKNNHQLGLVIESYGGLVNSSKNSTSLQDDDEKGVGRRSMFARVGKHQSKDDDFDVIPSMSTRSIFSLRDRESDCHYDTGDHQENFRIIPDFRKSVSRRQILDRSFLLSSKSVMHFNVTE